MTDMLWKTTFALLLGSGTILLLLALILRMTVRAQHIFFVDRYHYTILPSHLVFLAVLSLLAAFVLWKTRLS